VLGEQQWRQRNLTVVGGGQSVCIVAHCPLKLWKKSKEARRTLDGIVQSVRFRLQP
jgi:lysine/ornithine N-monooxygenase